ncbi:MAG: acyltransferase [Caldimonas sp.]
MNGAPPRHGKLHGVQGLRGLAVLLVLSIHLFHVEHSYSKGPLVLGPWIHVNVVGLDIFLVISGFVITMLGFGKFTNGDYVRSYAYNRITRVYPVYILYTLPLVFVYLWRPEMFNASEGHDVSLWRSLLLIPDKSLPLIPVAWTLHHELYFYLVVGVLLCFPERHFPRGIALWCLFCTVMVAAGWNVDRADKGPFERVLESPINYDFILGMTAAWLVHKGVRRYAWWCMAIGTVGAIVGYFTYYALTGVERVDDHWTFLIFGVPAVLITYAVVVLELRQRWRFAPWLGWVGDAAYSLYLTHVMSIVLAGYVWRAIGIPGWPAHLLFMAGTIAFALWIGWIAYTRIERPLSDWFRNFDPARRRAMAR